MGNPKTITSLVGGTTTTTNYTYDAYDRLTGASNTMSCSPTGRTGLGYTYRGFDAGRTSYGTGLQGIADRLAALGGTLEVRSVPGAGTALLGMVPSRRRSSGRSNDGPAPAPHTTGGDRS